MMPPKKASFLSSIKKICSLRPTASLATKGNQIFKPSCSALINQIWHGKKVQFISLKTMKVTFFSAAATPTYNLTIFSHNCRILSSLQKNASTHRKWHVRSCKLNSLVGVAIIKYVVISFSPLQCDDCMMQEKKTNYKAIQMDM